jgi:hypothetical protein
VGTCYSLIRRDVLTEYDLGKAWFLHRVFTETPQCVTAAEVDTLVALIVAAERGDLDGEHDVTLHRPAEASRDPYWHAVALDIVDWAEGQPFEFHSEHSGLVEEISMDTYERETHLVRLWKTGDRHETHDPAGVSPREQLARRRREDEAFRRGCVWRDLRSKTERVLATPLPPHLRP